MTKIILEFQKDFSLISVYDSVVLIMYFLFYLNLSSIFLLEHRFKIANIFTLVSVTRFNFFRTAYATI